MTYEGALVAIPLQRDAATTGAVIAANRGASWADAMVREYERNWATIDGAAEFNFFALSSMYGSDLPPFERFQWGLTEDIANISTHKFDAVARIKAGGGRGLAAAGGDEGHGTGSLDERKARE